MCRYARPARPPPRRRGWAPGPAAGRSAATRRQWKTRRGAAPPAPAHRDSRAGSRQNSPRCRRPPGPGRPASPPKPQSSSCRRGSLPSPATAPAAAPQPRPESARGPLYRIVVCVSSYSQKRGLPARVRRFGHRRARRHAPAFPVYSFAILGPWAVSVTLQPISVSWARMASALAQSLAFLAAARSSTRAVTSAGTSSFLRL